MKHSLFVIKITNVDALFEAIQRMNLEGATKTPIKSGYVGEFKGYKLGDTFYPAIKSDPTEYPVKITRI